MRPEAARRAQTAVTAAACILFTAYAGSFLYFFVDDEAIPLVYARNLLRGRGLVYTALEGRVEGYSDFLHVLWSSVLLALTRAWHLSLLTPLLIGKAVSFAAAIAVIVATARILRQQNLPLPGFVAALGFLSLCGPLAAWACSSLETVPFALLLTAFLGALLSGAPRAAALCGIAAVLMRIDGAVYVVAIMLAVAAAIPARRAATWRAAQSIALVAAVYHAWRIWYFRAVLSAPLAAKVLYRLSGTSQAMVKSPDMSYLLAFAQVYGLASIAVLAVVIAAAWRNREARACAIALVILGLYVQTVGDWMFGWRFLVALLPMVAIVLGVSIGRLPRAAGWAAACLTIAWSAAAARTFNADFVDAERKPIFWSAPRGGQAVWLGRYYELIAASRPLIGRGERIAYNQAGVLPYLLDLENVDDLGICSKFVASLPTTDVYYTAVGRYSPLTNQPVLRTAQAYLMYQGVRFVVSPTDLLTKANHDVVPRELLDGLFERVAIDASGANAIYRRTAKPADRYRSDPAMFTENLAHTTHLLHASVQGETVPAERYGADLPFLREQALTRSFSGDLAIDLEFARHDEDVSSLFIGSVDSQAACTLTVMVRDASGREAARLTIAAPAGGRTIYERFPPGVRGRAMSLTINGPSGDNRVTIADVRLEGQSGALRDYLKKHLTFVTAPAPGTR
jgi:hypothetical protein